MDGAWVAEPLPADAPSLDRRVGVVKSSEENLGALTF